MSHRVETSLGGSRIKVEDWDLDNVDSLGDVGECVDVDDMDPLDAAPTGLEENSEDSTCEALNAAASGKKPAIAADNEAPPADDPKGAAKCRTGRRRTSK